MPSNNPSQSLKTFLSRSLQTTSLTLSKLSLSIPSNSLSHTLKTLSLNPFKKPFSRSQNTFFLSPLTTHLMLSKLSLLILSNINFSCCKTLSPSSKTTTSSLCKTSSLDHFKQPLSCSQNSLSQSL